MRLPKSISDNLHFLVVETASQVDNLRRYFEHPSPAIGQRILERAGYAYNLKILIHESCLRQIALTGENEADTLSLRAIESIATDLERIAEFCRDCINQLGYVKHASCFRSTDYLPMLKQVTEGITLTESGASDSDTGKVLKIGDIERKLDQGYQRLLGRYTSALKKKGCKEDLICALFVAKTIEQMGDALLDIAESIISANLGQPVNMDRYRSIKASVQKLETDNKLSDLEIEPVAETRSKKKAAAGHMRQLAKRLPEVYAVHPEFLHGNRRIGEQDVPSLDALLRRARLIEARLEAPFSVYIHGDFNVDNIIYDPLEKKINFIDLHRSRYMDYVQDVSVFMVSNYRLQVLDAPLRRRIMQTCLAFHGFAANYARRANDKSFEVRLALGLARSFASSTRFILDKGLSSAMFLRARYLLERVIEADPKNPGTFHTPVEELFT